VKLRVLSPARAEVDADVEHITVDGAHGSFTLLPRHADFLADLVPGLMLYEVDGIEHVLALDGGTLVKCGDEVLVSSPNVVHGSDLETLRRDAMGTFADRSEHERQARSALQRIEADFVRRFIELQHVD